MNLVKTGSKWSATLLIVGCTIGAGMIGLPVRSALAGLVPTTVAMILCYGFATGTGLLILEATLWFDHKVNLISMADHTLGKGARFGTWSLFLFLFYCIFVAYIDGGGQLFSSLISFLLHHPVSREVGIVACVAFVGAVVYAGTRAISYVNRLFLLGLAAAYFSLVFLALPNVNTEQLLYSDWKASLATLPILLISFGNQNLIPTLTYYVKKNVRMVRFAIFVGNLIPFGIYFLWNYVILGILPETNPSALAAIAHQSDMVTGLLEKASEPQKVLLFVQAFSFFAILTPFIANTLAFVDFLKDGFKMPAETKYELAVYALVLGPPILLTLSYPRLFLKALGFAGGFADVLLFGVMPTLIVWIGRYHRKMEGPYRVAGGKLLLGLIFLFSIGVLLIKV